MKKNQITIKFLLISLLMGTFLFGTMPSFAQNLEGKWVWSKDPSNRLSKSDRIVMQFTKDSLMVYDFNKSIDVVPYHLKDNSINININDDRKLELQVLNPDLLLLKTDRAKDSAYFMRLKPTKTKLTSAEIRKIEYSITKNEEKHSFRFNKPFGNSQDLFKLEKIDSTYFWSQYSNKIRKGAVPISSVTTKKLVLNFSPHKSMVLLGEDADGNVTKNTSASASNEKLSTAEAIIGKWFYSHIEGRPPLSNCTKKTFFQFKEELSLQTKPYAKNFSNGNCVAGSSISGTYKLIDDDRIEVIQNGTTETWEIQSLTKTKLVVERDGRALRLTKK